MKDEARKERMGEYELYSEGGCKLSTLQWCISEPLNLHRLTAQCLLLVHFGGK
jgi:hypothetical protein